MKTRVWVHAKVAGRGFRCNCEICRFSWSAPGVLSRPTVSDAITTMCRHVADYHGGVDQHD